MKTHALWFLMAAVTMIVACDKDDDSTIKNQKPIAKIISPLDGATFNFDDTLQILAEATDPDGNIEKVLFYVNHVLVGTDTATPYQCKYAMTKAGDHLLVAKATDNLGADALSDSIFITVRDPDGPDISLSFFPDKYHYYEFDSLRIDLSAISPNGKIVSSALFIDNYLFAVDSTYPYSFFWDSIPAGSYRIYGTAEDEKGRTGTSSIKYFTAMSNTPPTVEIWPNGVPSYEYLPGKWIDIDISANDPDGTIDSIQIFANDDLIATRRMYFDFMWTDATAGTYALVAKAFDNKGGIGLSSPKHIKVLPGIIYNGAINKLTYSENDDLVFGLNQATNKLLLINPIESVHTEITLPFSQPIDMEYSVQDQKLYIIYKFSGSISVFDHNTQSLSEMEFSVVDDGRGICIDPLHRRIYVLSTAGLHILDMQNGDVILDAASIQGASLVIEPDHQWLFTATAGSSNELIYKYSVEGDVLNLIQIKNGGSGAPQIINIHPDGDYVVLPYGGGSGGANTILAFSTLDLNNVLGEFVLGYSPRFAAFSPDGNYMLGANIPTDEIYVMNARSFVQQKQIAVPHAGDYVRMTTNYTASKIIVFSYDYNYQRDHVIYFFDL